MKALTFRCYVHGRCPWTVLYAFSQNHFHLRFFETQTKLYQHQVKWTGILHDYD